MVLVLRTIGLLRPCAQPTLQQTAAMSVLKYALEIQYLKPRSRAQCHARVLSRRASQVSVMMLWTMVQSLATDHLPRQIVRFAVWCPITPVSGRPIIWIWVHAD